MKKSLPKALWPPESSMMSNWVVAIITIGTVADFLSWSSQRFTNTSLGPVSQKNTRPTKPHPKQKNNVPAAIPSSSNPLLENSW